MQSRLEGRRGEGGRSRTSNFVLHWHKAQNVREPIMEYFPKAVCRPFASESPVFVKICPFLGLI